MKKNSGFPSTLAAGFAVLVFSATAAVARPSYPGETQKVDPCSLLTKAEIQEILGKPVSDGKLNTKANAAVGLPCEFTVGDYGVVSILAIAATPSNNPDQVMAQLKKMNIEVADVPGVGDRFVLRRHGLRDAPAQYLERGQLPHPHPVPPGRD